MKELLICASAVGIVTGIAYLLYKKGSFKSTADKSAADDVNTKPQEKDSVQNENEKVVEELCHAKRESVQAVYERHSQAKEIMRDAYTNIMEDFVEDFSDEKNIDSIKPNVVIDSESVSVMKEMDLISDELDDLLK